MNAAKRYSTSCRWKAPPPSSSAFGRQSPEVPGVRQRRAMRSPQSRARVAQELVHIRPQPPALRIFDAGMGDATVAHAGDA